MRVYPQNLGIKWHVALVRSRAQRANGQTDTGNSTTAASDPPAPRQGRLGRLWARGLNLDPAQAAHALPAGLRPVMGGIYTVFIFGGVGAATLLRGVIDAATGLQLSGPEFLALWSTLTASGVLLYPRFHFQGLHRKPLAAAEVEALLPGVRDELERAYLVLVIDAVRQEVSPEAEKEIQGALRALGRALEHLPPAPAIPENAGDLRREAARLQAESRAETDPVVAASVERQAESLLRLAAVAERSSQVVRRSAALRAELAMQTRALHAGLTSFHTGDPAADAAGLSHLAEAVRHVASEAISVAAAREELDGPAAIRPLAADEAPAVPLRAEQG